MSERARERVSECTVHGLRSIEPSGLVVITGPAQLARDVGGVQLEIVVQHHDVGVVVGFEPALAAVEPCNPVTPG